MRRRDPVTAPPRKNVFMNASALQGPSKGGLPRPSEDEGILSTLTSGGSLLAPFEEEPTAPPEYPDVEKAIEESMESFHRVIAARYGVVRFENPSNTLPCLSFSSFRPLHFSHSLLRFPPLLPLHATRYLPDPPPPPSAQSCTLCMPEVAPRNIQQSEHLIEVFVFHCFDNEVLSASPTPPPPLFLFNSKHPHTHLLPSSSPPSSSSPLSSHSSPPLLPAPLFLP